MSYFERVGEHRYQPTPHADGAWQPGVELHMAPVAGLITQEIERFYQARQAEQSAPAGAPLVVSRLSFDILGVIGARELEISVDVIRPGRTIELLEAVVAIEGRSTIRCRAWLLAASETGEAEGGAPDPLPPPEGLPSHPMSTVWKGGFINSLDVRPVEPATPGRVRAWLTTNQDLVEGEPSSGLGQWVGLVDTANGIAVRESPDEWLFPNVDLTIYLYRQPQGPWVGLDTTVIFGADGRGLTSSVLHDRHGPVGRSEQVLTLRRA